jgi:DNA-binding CsgD family transcriptional regulator/tetratricopeptide (TPR) repeat protein
MSMGERTPPSSALIGREAVLAELIGQLDVVGATRRASIVVLRGDAGIGKSMVFDAFVDGIRARDCHMLVARPAPTDARLDLSALAEMLATGAVAADSGLNELRRGLAEGLARDRDDVGGAGAAAIAFAEGVHRVCESKPVVIAVDDAHWLDPLSAAAISYAVRRARDRAVLVVCGLRSGETLPLGELRRLVDDGHVTDLLLEPLGIMAIRSILLARCGIELSKPTLVRLVERSGGNPMFATELARHLSASSRPADIDAVAPSLAAAITNRLADAPPSVRAAVAVVALADVPTTSLIEKVLGGSTVAGTIDEACRRDLLVAEGDRFVLAHPLLLAGVLSLLDVETLHGIHAQLAEHSKSPITRAFHLGAAADAPNSRVASAVEAGAAHAAARHSFVLGAELYERSAELTPEGAEGDRRAARLIAAADLWHKAGDPARAVELCASANIDGLADPLRLDAIITQALATADAVGFDEAIALLATAHAAASDSPGRAAMARYCSRMSLFCSVPNALRWAKTAQVESVACNDSAGTELALGALVTAKVLAGEPVAIELAASMSTATIGERSNWLELLVWLQRLEEAEAFGTRLLVDARTTGHGRLIANVVGQMGIIAIGRGRVAEALELLREQYDLELTMDSAGIALPSLDLAIALAIAGDSQEARMLCATAASSAVPLVQCVHAARLGSIELILGNATEAVGHLRRARHIAFGFGLHSVSVLPYWADLIEALVLIGADDEATELQLEFESATAQHPGTSASIETTRTRGMLLASAGDLPAARATLASAVGRFAATPYRLERARTLLALGSVDRRARQWAAAKTTLGEAVSEFTAMGAVGWLRRAQDELNRVGGRRPVAPTDGELTMAESQVVALIAEGLSNGQIAARLIVSVRTVEAHLTRIFRKLGVTNRGQLAALNRTEPTA